MKKVMDPDPDLAGQKLRDPTESGSSTLGGGAIPLFFSLSPTGYENNQ